MLQVGVLTVALMIGFVEEYRHMAVYVDRWPDPNWKAAVCRDAPDLVEKARTVEVLLAVPAEAPRAFRFVTVFETEPWECVDGIRYEKRDPDSNPGYVRPADPDHGRGSQ